jgi:putative transposase
MGTDTTRAQYSRAELASPSDLTDAEWALLEPFVPPASHVGRPRKWPLRRIVEAILYLLRGGLPWQMLPPCFPPVSTVRRWFYLWRNNGLWLSLNHALLLIGHEAAAARHRPAPA